MIKRTSCFSIAIVAILALISSSAVSAQTRYVTDSFEIMMRTGPGVKNKIIKALKSGTKIEVLREDAGNGHSQVRTQGGEIGYVLTRFLSSQDSARNQVLYLESLLKDIKSKPQELQARLLKSQEENQILIKENTSLTTQLKQAQDELSQIKEISSDAVKIAAENERLKAEEQQLYLQLDDFRIQNQTLKDNANYVRNLTMTGILLLGLFLGWVLSRSGKQRRNSWGS